MPDPTPITFTFYDQRCGPPVTEGDGSVVDYYQVTELRASCRARAIRIFMCLESPDYEGGEQAEEHLRYVTPEEVPPPAQDVVVRRRGEDLCHDA
jgi:hypothetical protein